MAENAEDPRVTRSRARAVDAARRVFLDEGYAGATLERVADEAGIAKRTLYNLYDDKEALFRATILSAIEVADRFAASIAAEVRQAAGTVDDLVEIGTRLADATLLGPALPLRRLLVMESARFPDLVRDYRARAPEAVVDALAALFTHLAATGSVRTSDPIVAAEHFAFLVMGAELDRAMFSGMRPSPQNVRRRAIAGAQAFARAYLR